MNYQQTIFLLEEEPMMERTLDKSAQWRVNIAIGAWHVEYVAVMTTTPRRYDYGYVLELNNKITIDNPGNGKYEDARLVLVPVDKVDYQVGRYCSCIGYQTFYVDPAWFGYDPRGFCGVLQSYILDGLRPA